MDQTNEKSIGALWEKESKKGMKYFSGKINDQKIVGFFTKAEDLAKNEKLPTIRIYTSKELEKNPDPNSLE